MGNHSVKLRGRRVILRTVEENDLPKLYQFIHGEPEPEWKKWDAPYFPIVPETFEAYREKVVTRLAGEESPSLLVIEHDGAVIGVASYYWEHQPSYWLEMGIVIFVPAYWSNGYGTEVLRLWGDYLFEQMPLVRIGLTTWSGNDRMIRCAEKLGMQMEGRMRKCRLYNGVFYDSIRMGILREEWEAHKELRA